MQKHEALGPRSQAVLWEAGAAPDDVLDGSAANYVSDDPPDDPLDEDDATLRELWPIPALVLLGSTIDNPLSLLIILPTLLVVGVPTLIVYLGIRSARDDRRPTSENNRSEPTNEPRPKQRDASPSPDEHPSGDQHVADRSEPNSTRRRERQ